MVGLTDEDYFDLGKYSRIITTSSPAAQRWFDRGLNWAFGFNHPEAVNCFEQVIKLDPDCIMGYWGATYSSGPYYNKWWGLFDPKDLERAIAKCYRLSREGLKLVEAGKGSPVEQALLRALAHRHPRGEPAEDYSVWSRQYVAAMEDVYREFGDDLDVAHLYADSLMNLTPWALYDPYTGDPPANARTLDAKAAVEKALHAGGYDGHPGLLHLHVHLMEMSRTPEAAVPAADKLRHLCPDGGHLLHMASHIDVLIGDYRAAITANANAIVADHKYLDIVGAGNRYTFYRLHNYHSLIYAAMLSGQSGVALEQCTKMEATVPHDMMRIPSPPMADWIEAFRAVRIHVLIRFGKWDDILALAIPEDQELYCVTTATLHYARGIAYAATGRVEEAVREQELFTAAHTRVPASRIDFPNKCRDILHIAAAMLAGEIEYRKGNYDEAFVHLRRSIELDDNLIYSEPWSWMQPARHAYAALLLEQGRVEEAMRAYAEDLGFIASIPRGHQHPNNIWALHGYRECLRLLGREAEAVYLDLPMQLAEALADVKVKSSCFCRRVVVDDDDGDSDEIGVAKVTACGGKMG